MVFIRSLPTPLLRDPDIHRMVIRLAHGELTDEKIEWLAKAIFRLGGWAGTPVPWDEIHQRSRDEYLLNAQAVLFGGQACT